MSYCWFNRQKLLKKVKDRYHNCGGKGKTTEYYLNKKWKENMERAGTETGKKIQAKILIVCIIKKWVKRQ